MSQDREGAFERCYRLHFRSVAAYALARADRDLAEDAVTRTFEVAWRRFEEMPEDALPWLLGVERRVLADLRRSRDRQAALVERITLVAITDGEGWPDTSERTTERAAAVQALRSLSPSQREALLLIAWDGLTESQAAKVAGVSRGTFAVRLHRARARLRAEMRSVEPTADDPPVVVGIDPLPAFPTVAPIKEAP